MTAINDALVDVASISQTADRRSRVAKWRAILTELYEAGMRAGRIDAASDEIALRSQPRTEQETQ